MKNLTLSIVLVAVTALITSSVTNVCAADIVAEIIDRGFDLLDAPPVRVGAPNVPMPYNAGLEAICIPDEENINEAVRKVMSND